MEKKTMSKRGLGLAQPLSSLLEQEAAGDTISNSVAYLASPTEARSGSGVSEGGGGSRVGGDTSPRGEQNSSTLSTTTSTSTLMVSTNGTRGERAGLWNPEPPQKVAKWRMKQRMKTVSVALVMCLNIGVDPPDVIKTSPCARHECWIDPLATAPPKALDAIGKALQQQYERWQSRAKYKQSLDPTVDDVKKLCTGLRRNAKEERVLFHYNGHGVPRPTTNGELWVFNKNYTQYIPLSIYELQTWMGSPSIYVFDCSSAGLIVSWFLKFAEQREKESESAAIKDYIMLAACAADELLPMNPDLPADVFTACLTTPIKIALQWFCQHSVVVKGVTPDMIDKLPGRMNDRKTPLGELNWIFTAVTDTIAWNVLPRELFQKLFRQDLLVASLFRNFLLAERIMRSANCTPVSFPALPPTYQHPMWQAWDLAADLCLAQLSTLLSDPAAEYQHSPFFTEQLTAFEVWLEFGSESKRPPEQLPIVLQVLLSQAHRLRALVLLGKFLDLGPWAVNLALSVGIFPYVLKLLQSPAVELRPTLVFIWAKILALDKSCQLDLVKDNGHSYFINILANNSIPADQRTMSAFVLAAVADDCKPGQSACLNSKLINICLASITDPHPLLRQWISLCLAKLWENCDEGKWTAIKELAHQRICVLLTDPVSEVRAAAVYALGTFMGGAGDNEQRKSIELNLAVTLPVVTADGSPVVRRELAIALAKLVRNYEENCKEVALEMIREEIRLNELRVSGAKRASKSVRARTIGSAKGLEDEDDDEAGPPSAVVSTVYGCLWKMVLSLAQDPFPAVATVAQAIVYYIHRQLQIDGHDKTMRSPSVGLLRRYAPSASSNILGIASPRARTAREATLRRTASVDEMGLNQSGNNPTIPPGPEGQQQAPADSTLPTLEVHSEFYNWAWSHFSRPSAGSEETDVTHPSYTQRVWKHEKNKNLMSLAKKNRNKRHKLDEQIAILDNESEMASLLAFHPLENLLVVTDNKDGVCVWNWLDSRKVNIFKNGNPPGTRISSIALINPCDHIRLLTAADNGVIRLWKDYTEEDAPELITAWKALPDLTPRPGPGMITNWQQQHGLLMTSGDVGIVRVWDMERELAIQDIITGSDSCVTSLASQAGKGHLLVAGCGDGSVRLFDIRTPPKYTSVITYSEHKKWVVGIAMTYLDCQIISGSLNGEVKFWDVRKTISYKTLNSRITDTTAFSVHPFLPILAVGSQQQKIQVVDFDGHDLNQIRHHEGFLGQRIGPISCLSFHPYRSLLAAGATDSIVSVYTSSVKD
eukprot:TRINITY_DN7897_c0_g1_i1.p1 TRINITY_DN7897_c0_g1~~TRINITY_DN7897_c0_g1_i1.p1  ORF type:complete len:1276 (+),score=189.83 TRINITY_DN7897_c0_g1_i1:564-4391(+)